MLCRSGLSLRLDWVCYFPCYQGIWLRESGLYGGVRRMWELVNAEITGNSPSYQGNCFAKGAARLIGRSLLFSPRGTLTVPCGCATAIEYGVIASLSSALK